MSASSRLNDISILLVSERDDAQGGLFREYFHNFPNVSVTKNPFEDLETVDCLVIPVASSYCIRDNEIAEYYFSRLPERTRDKILKTVQHDLFGEQQPGTAFIVKNTGKNEKYKYVAFLSLVRASDALYPIEFAYTALRGLLLSILEFNQKEGCSIEVIAIPSFAINNTPEHKRLVTRHMSLAYRNMFYPMKHLASAQEAKILTTQLQDKSTADTPAERRSRTKDLLVSGELKRRGLYTEDELRYLIELIETENDLRRTSATILAHFLHHSPSEFTVSMETIASSIAKSKAGLSYMLDEAENGTFALFKEIRPSELVMGEEIGNGTEACVFKALWDGRDVAVKRFRGIPSSTAFQRELSIMSLVQHPNLLRCYGGYSDTKRDEYFLVMDLMTTDVHAALHSSVAPPSPQPSRSVSASPPPQPRRESRSVLKVSPAPTAGGKRLWNMGYAQILKLALQTARGMEYLHDCNLIHRDLKSGNLLMDHEFNAKVSDFGLSRILAPKHQNMTGNVGTVSWIAPEVFEKQPYDTKADVYSFGIVMWELYAKQIPFEDLNTFEIPIAVIKGDRPPIPKDCPKEYSKLMQLCWHKKPSKRPTFQKIVKTLLKLFKEFGIDSSGLYNSSSGQSITASPAPLLTRGAGQSQSASSIPMRSKDSASPLNISTSSLEESVTTSSSRSEEDPQLLYGGANKGLSSSAGIGINPLTSSAGGQSLGRSNSPTPMSTNANSAGSFPRRRTSSSASTLKSNSSPQINGSSSPSKSTRTMRGSTEFSQVNTVPETHAI